MLVKVYGAKSPRLRGLIRDAVNYAADKFFDRRIKDNLEITIKFKNNLMKESGNIAECEWIDSHVRGRIFEVIIDRAQSTFLQIVSIMHEMVHIKQYAKGELVQSMKNCKDHKWNKTEWIDDEKVGYYDLPWEIEAHGREKGLTVGWIEKTDLLTTAEKAEWRAKFLF